MELKRLSTEFAIELILLTVNLKMLSINQSINRSENQRIPLEQAGCECVRSGNTSK